VSSLALADESVVKWAKERVQSGLVAPLAQHESSRFSRGRPPPRERRVRVTDAAPVVDPSGRAFVRFTVDVRFGSGEWHEGDIAGCAYTKTGALYVRRGDEWRPAEFLLGKNLDPVTGVCEAAPPARS
jgi:hypothetical protein